jgi:hypothetical protein
MSGLEVATGRFDVRSAPNSDITLRQGEDLCARRGHRSILVVLQPLLECRKRGFDFLKFPIATQENDDASHPARLLRAGGER